MSVWAGMGIWAFGYLSTSSPNESKEAKEVGKWICRAGIALGIAGVVRWMIEPSTSYVARGSEAIVSAGGSRVVVGPGLITVTA